ncbi:i-AAA protease yme1 [Batrachochytrium dendrobatidis]|nr:i-AAA protease yme1 [Batrachochytrium dendrobatidis]
MPYLASMRYLAFTARKPSLIQPLFCSSILLHVRSFTSKKLFQLESECLELGNRSDPTKQRELYKALYKSGSNSTLISRFEMQPQLMPVSTKYSAAMRAEDARRIQQDPESLSVYIAALAKERKLDRLVDYIAPLVSGASLDGDVAPFTPGSRASMENMESSSRNMQSFGGASASGFITPGREHTVHTNVSQWESALGSNPIHQQQSLYSRPAASGKTEPFSALRRSIGLGKNSSYPNSQPIQVVISEAWSWSKLARKLGSRLLLGILLMTGLSVILDQQGIMKSGMASGEVEPTVQTQTIKFADVQGVDEAKQELEEIVQFLKEPLKFMELGGKLPKGVLLYGPPGTGKTHLARAIAGEAGVPFFQMSGSEFDELYVGVGARRVRELFAAAKKRAPCIVFIDELDAVGSKRSTKDQSYMRQTLNQLLVELDGFSPTEGVILIAATNTPDSLDKALVRPGRFDRLVPVPLPDVKGRTQILKVHMRGVQMDRGVDASIIARGTPGFSGADLANIINHAAIKASKDSSKYVTMADLEWAKDKIIMGSERKSAVITDESKKLTAYHEGGHTLAALYTEGAMPLHKVTVIPRGNALGVTVQLPEGDRNSQTKRELIAMLDVCMGGRVAEELIYGGDYVTTGASSDLQKATSVARQMVLSYGMSKQVGLQSFDNESFEQASSQTRATVEAEVKLLLDSSYARTLELLQNHSEELHRLAQALIDYETLTQEEVKIVIKGGNLGKKF